MCAHCTYGWPNTTRCLFCAHEKNEWDDLERGRSCARPKEAMVIYMYYTLK